jgi:GT2 family glycosyltransferase
MKILVLMPMYKTMDAPCIISLVDFVQTLNQDGHEVKMNFTHGFNAAKARKILVAGIMKEEYNKFDYVLWLDSDHVYRTEALYKLIKRMDDEKLKMLSATYTLHGSPETAHGITENGKFRHFTQAELKHGVLDCQVVGFGFLVIRFQFLKKLWNKFGDELFVLDAKDNCTEDVKFCRCVLDSGERVSFDSDVKVGHVELAVRY